MDKREEKWKELKRKLNDCRKNKKSLVRKKGE
jgi:hypothetical protein